MKTAKPRSCIGKKRRYQDLTGQRFGKLVVQRLATETLPDGKKRELRDKYRRILWECKCDCGNTILAPGVQLIAGYRKSCSCLSKPPRKDWVGKRFGKLTVLSYEGKWSAVHHWKCLCDCGKITSVSQSNLNNGHTTSCGCMVKPFANRRCIEGTCIELIRSRKVYKANTSGVRGVYPLRKTGKWAAQIQFRGEKTYLGSYDTVEEAKQVREQAEIVFDQFLARYDAGELFEERSGT